MNEQDLSSILDTVIFLLRLWTLGGLNSPALKWASPGPMLALAWQEATLDCPMPPATLSVGSHSSPYCL